MARQSSPERAVSAEDVKELNVYLGKTATTRATESRAKAARKRNERNYLEKLGALKGSHTMLEGPAVVIEFRGGVKTVLSGTHRLPIPPADYTLDGVGRAKVGQETIDVLYVCPLVHDDIERYGLPVDAIKFISSEE